MENTNQSVMTTISNDAVLHSKIAQYAQLTLELYKENTQLKEEIENLKKSNPPETE